MVSRHQERHEMTVPPDDPTGDRPDGTTPEAAPDRPPADATSAGEMTDPEPFGGGLVVVGETTGVTAPEDPTEGHAGYDDPYEDVDHEAEAAAKAEQRNPARVWQIAAAILAVIAIVFAVIAFTGNDEGGGNASAPVTSDQEADAGGDRRLRRELGGEARGKGRAAREAATGRRRRCGGERPAEGGQRHAAVRPRRGGDTGARGRGRRDGGRRRCPAGRRHRRGGDPAGQRADRPGRDPEP